MEREETKEPRIWLLLYVWLFLFVCLTDSGTCGHVGHPPLCHWVRTHWFNYGCHCLLTHNLSLMLIGPSYVACLVSHHYALKALKRKKNACPQE